MLRAKGISVRSSVGARITDSSGSPVSVARLDTRRSYAGIGELLQDYINTSDEGAWQQIRDKIDYTYESLDPALAALQEETGFGNEIESRVATGRKLLVKPNLVTIYAIDPQMHGPGMGSTACTEWAFVAALMRWLHDRLDISYHQMCLGEAATTMPAASGLFTLLNPDGRPVTPEAAIEGRVGDFYGGWGFYFARKYLAETHDPSHTDDPMLGYQESVAGTCIPPGDAPNRLMVYDLNSTGDDLSREREVEVPDGANFRSIALHKAVVGGDPNDPEDVKAYPGCVLVNVPKLKVHQLTLLTAAMKNVGIGLCPMQAAEKGEDMHRWKYSTPYNAVPGLKAGLPHARWLAEVDEATGVPRRNSSGSCIMTRTHGLAATMADVVKAVASQDVFILHVVDGIDTINRDHTGSIPGTREPEGLVFAGLDPVATDLLCARYMFSNVPMDEAQQAGIDDGNGGPFPQKVPVPAVEDGNIVTGAGYDCPLARDPFFRYAEKRGLGTRAYHVVGHDAVSDRPLASLEGRLGTVDGGTFSELVTGTMYFDVFKVPWDLQRTSLAYLEAVDQLAGSSLKQEFLEAFDEDGDGAISYEEFGKNGLVSPILALMGVRISMEGRTRLGHHHGSFTLNATLLKLSNPAWNADGHDMLRYFYFGPACLAAYTMSQLGIEGQDPFLSGLTWGQGKWPSFKLASYMQLGNSIYGAGFPLGVSFPSMYGHCLRYADMTQNSAEYTGNLLFEPDPGGVQRYMTDVASGAAKPLDFTLYVPAGYGSLSGNRVPNVEETGAPAKVFTVTFAGGSEVW
ncbi:MAG: DUF362 domain-containing protein [Chloroflexota bacterium]|nr:DUF362 domain-containing protein [Chloroflexota bacterium]